MREKFQIRNFSGLYFPPLGVNTKFYGINLRIQSKCWKIRTRKKFVFGHFSRSRKEFQHILMDMMIFFYINTFTFIAPCAQIQFKDPSREIGGLLRNRLSNVSLKLDISNVKAEREKYIF